MTEIIEYLITNAEKKDGVYKTKVTIEDIAKYPFLQYTRENSIDFLKYEVAVEKNGGYKQIHIFSQINGDVEFIFNPEFIELLESKNKTVVKSHNIW